MRYKIQIISNITYYIGKNAQGNNDIIDMAKPNDIWLHVDNVPSGHVIISIPDNITKDELRHIIKVGANLCKSTIKNNTKIKVVYTKVCNINKTNILGCVQITDEKYILI